MRRDRDRPVGAPLSLHRRSRSARRRRRAGHQRASSASATARARRTACSLVAHDLVLDRTFVHGSRRGGPPLHLAEQRARRPSSTRGSRDCHSNNGDSQAHRRLERPGPVPHPEQPSRGRPRGRHVRWRRTVDHQPVAVRHHHPRQPHHASVSVEGRVADEEPHRDQARAPHAHRRQRDREQLWPDAQAGFAFLLKSENQNGDAPWTQSTDITIRYNCIRNMGNGFNIAANPGRHPAVPAARMTIVDNMIRPTSARYGGDGIPLQILGDLSADVIVAHNTWSNAGLQAISFDGMRPSTPRHPLERASQRRLRREGHRARVREPVAERCTLPGNVFAYDVIVGAQLLALSRAPRPVPRRSPSSWPKATTARTIGAEHVAS